MSSEAPTTESTDLSSPGDVPRVDALTDLAALEETLERSGDRPQLLFKHSNTCPISGAAHRAFEQYLEDSPAPGVDYSLIVVQDARPVSNAAAERLEVRHESPQAILVQDGRAVWSASHWSITRQALAEALSEAGA